ncbi:MAG TPA: non-homologous end-joining DNA ligase [Terriglobales bacterium]|nr:non-homologous end-joining DNA ligase [Terriglobales bacterium]
MPTAIYPMLATSTEQPFDGPEWFFEIKWDGYRAIAFLQKGTVRLVSRNQNDLTAQYADLHDMAQFVDAKTAILDGEIIALDEEGRSSFSLMQQRTGFRDRNRRVAPRRDISVLYYAFDLLYLDGYDLHRATLEGRKATLASLLTKPNDTIRYSEHFVGEGKALFDAARRQGLEGILAKKRDCPYEERRSHNWLKIKIRHQIECVIGGYTDPEGSRQYFGSIVLGLYDKEGRLVHVGQAGSGFDQKTLAVMWKVLHKLETKNNPFHGAVDALRKTHWIKPELVAQIEFSEWTHLTNEGGQKLRAPVFLGLREDKDPKECTFDQEG